MMVANLLMAVAVAPPAPLPPVEADIRCVVVSLAIAANPDFSAIGGMSSLYWFGRLHGRLGGQALEDAIVAQALTMTAADIELESQRCGTEMQAEGAALSKMGAAITRRAERADTR